MPSEIRVDTHKSSAGLGTVTFNNSGQVFTGITTVSTLSVTGGITGTWSSGTSSSSASSTSIDFTGIPSYAKRVTVMFDGVSTNGSSGVFLRLGSASGVESTSYISTVLQTGQGTGGSTSTAGFLLLRDGFVNNTILYSGLIIVTKLTGNIWAMSGNLGYNTADGSGLIYMYISSGSKSLADTLDRLRITTVNGTDTFDAGSIGILYEG